MSLAVILHNYSEHILYPSNDVMLATLAIWEVPQEFIKSLQPRNYLRVL